MTKTEQEARSKRTKTIVTIITLLALAILVFSIRDQIIQTYRDIQRVNIWAIAIIPFALLLKYHALTQMHREILAFFGERIRYRSMFRVQLELNMVNTVFPSGGVTGVSYFGVRMKDADVSGGKSTIVQFMKFILLFVSFQILLAAGLLMLAIEGQASSLLILIAGSLATLLFVITAILAYILSSKRLINNFLSFVTKQLNKFIHFFRRSKPETISIDKVENVFTELHESYLKLKGNKSVLKRPLLFALLSNVAEILALYSVYMAFNSFVNPGAVIIAFAIANFAGLVSILPGGIGIYEALMTATLAAAGVSAALSLPVTVMYRILTSIMQLVPGYYYYHKNLHARPESKRQGY
jgi:putative heme transporter